MAIKIGANLSYNGKLPNFERDRFATKAAMKAFPETSIDDGHLSYCAEDGNTYQFKSSNSVDAATGKWIVFKTDIDLSAYATKDSVAADLTKKVDITGLANETIKPAPFIVKIATITIPHIENISGTIDFNIQSRQILFNVNINVAYTTNFAKLDAKVFDTLVTTKKSKLYYHVDTTNTIAKIVLYYKAVQYDVVTTKVTNLTGMLKLGYNIDNIIVDALPEGAIEVHNINYGNKNLFYATPKDADGDPKFRAINVVDLPDLSSKYATKEKAFTKDTVSTEPAQVVAGPATTQGNLYLRKLIAYDIPDLKNEYQKLDSNGYQEKAKVAGLIVKHGNTGDTGSGYLIAEIDQAVGGQIGPDWYYATDGTLQDIKTKIPKVVLDDAVSTTSDNGVKNSVITKYVDSKVIIIDSSIADIRSSLESTQIDFVDLRDKVKAMPKTVFITQAAYNALTTKDANTIYYING